MTNYKTFHRPLQGRVVDLVPLTEAHTQDVVRMRNLPHVRQFFDEATLSTPESQSAFYKNLYAQNPSDLYWCVAAKTGDIIGTNRLNEIDGDSGTKGSQIIDDAHANSGPYALESELLLIKFAFEILKLNRVRAVIRPDNDKVVNFNLKLGFYPAGHCELRGRNYDVYEITPDLFHSERFDDLIGYFAARSRH